jgi:hypothetical protein
VLAEYRGQRRAGLSPRARSGLLVAKRRAQLLLRLCEEHPGP